MLITPALRRTVNGIIFTIVGVVKRDNKIRIRSSGVRRKSKINYRNKSKRRASERPSVNYAKIPYWHKLFYLLKTQVKLYNLCFVINVYNSNYYNYLLIVSFKCEIIIYLRWPFFFLGNVSPSAPHLNTPLCLREISIGFTYK